MNPPNLYGLCAEVDPELFFPEKGGTTRPAKEICRRCDLQAACLEWALTNDERFGVWGGTSEYERQKVRSARQRAAVAAMVQPSSAGAA